MAITSLGFQNIPLGPWQKDKHTHNNSMFEEAESYMAVGGSYKLFIQRYTPIKHVSCIKMNYNK